MLGQQMRFQTPEYDKGDGWAILLTISIFPFIAVMVPVFGWLGWLN